MKNWLILLAIALVFAACESIGVFEKNTFFANHSWKSSEQPSYTFTITDTNSLYHIYTVVRHEDAYRYNNLWLRFTTKAPGDTAKSQLLNLRLADNKKGWLGTGMDDIFDHRIRITRTPQKLRSGTYIFTLQQIMREDPLPAILNTGIRIEKSCPMMLNKPPKLAVVTFVYWFLLLYMIAALAWWFIALANQNTAITNIRMSELIKDDPDYYNKVLAIQDLSKRKTAQYIGEGLTFLAFILFGAVFVYRAIRRQFKFSAQQENFMMAITHELKTPIAVAQLNLETLQKRKLDEGQQQKLIANTLQEANRLNTLCNNILFTSQLDAGGYSAIKQSVNLTDLVETAVDDCKSRFPDRLFTEAIQEEVFLQGDAFLLQMLLNNLVENAIKYSPKEKPIKVSLTAGNAMIKVSIADEGAGIIDAEKIQVFEKFYRSGNENIRKAQGTGLGLYLCKKIVETHNGNIFVTDNQPNGSIFTVIFKS